MGTPCAVPGCEAVVVAHADELHQVDGLPGCRLQRLTDAVRLQLNPMAAESALAPTHIELRTVPLDGEVRVTLWSQLHHEYLTVLNGDLVDRELCLAPGEFQEVVLRAAQDGAPPARHPRGGFAPSVSRIRISGTGRLHVVGATVLGAARAPFADEMPSFRWVAWGSSITQGFSSPRLMAPWTLIAAHRTGSDVRNLGFGGCNHADRAIIDHLSTRSDWNLLTAELGINLVDEPLRLADFAVRVRHVAELAASRPDTDIALVTALPAAADRGTQRQRRRLEDMRDVVRGVASHHRVDNLHVLEGVEMLGGTHGLSADGTHPSQFGHHALGERMAAWIGSLRSRSGMDLSK